MSPATEMPRRRGPVLSLVLDGKRRPRLRLIRQHDLPVGPANRKGLARPRRACRLRHQPRRARNRRKPRPRFRLVRQHHPPVEPANRKGPARPRRAYRLPSPASPRSKSTEASPSPQAQTTTRSACGTREPERLLRVLEGHRGPVASLAALEIDGSLALASGSRRQHDPPVGRANGKALRVLEGHGNPVTSLAALEIDGSLALASGSTTNTIRLWDPRTGKALRVLEGHKSHRHQPRRARNRRKPRPRLRLIRQHDPPVEPANRKGLARPRRA